MGIIMMAMGIVLLVLVVAVGNFMSARPSANELWLDKVRMTARTMGLNPKLVPYPNWLPPKNTTSDSPYVHKTQGMIAQYGVLDDHWRLPQANFLAIAGKWQRQTVASCDERMHRQKLSRKADRLHDVSMELPMLADFVVGLSMQANSVLIFWDDDKYAQACGRQNQDEMLIKAQLQNLAERLHHWGTMVNAP